MIEKAFVSGQIAQSIFQDDDQLFIINASDTDKVADCTPYEKSLFFSSGTEIKVLENISIEELRKELLKEKACFDAIYGAIGGFDKNLTEETRILSIQHAESLIENPDIYDFVISRFFGNPVPKEADLGKAIEFCAENNFPEMKVIYINLLQGKDLIGRILHIFGDTITELGLEPDFVKIKNLFISTGLFAKLFLNTIDKNLENLRTLDLEYKNNTELKEKGSVVSAVLTRVISRVEQEYDLKIPKLEKTNGIEFEIRGIESVITYVVQKPTGGFVKDKKKPYNKKS
jgi:acyl carrier protein